MRLEIIKGIMASFILFMIVVTVFVINKNTKYEENIKDISFFQQQLVYAQDIKYYDEVLTQSMFNYIYSQDEKWSERYHESLLKLENVLNSAIEENTNTQRGFPQVLFIFKKENTINTELVEMEYQIDTLVRDGFFAEALDIIESDKYKENKRILEDMINDFIDYSFQQIEKQGEDMMKISDDIYFFGYTLLTILVLLELFIIFTIFRKIN